MQKIIAEQKNKNPQFGAMKVGKRYVTLGSFQLSPEGHAVNELRLWSVTAKIQKKVNKTMITGIHMSKHT